MDRFLGGLVLGRFAASVLHRRCCSIPPLPPFVWRSPTMAIELMFLFSLSYFFFSFLFLPARPSAPPTATVRPFRPPSRPQHRDIKLENICFESMADDAEVKLVDFGLSASFKVCVHERTPAFVCLHRFFVWLFFFLLFFGFFCLLFFCFFLLSPIGGVFLADRHWCLFLRACHSKMCSISFCPALF